MASTTPASRPNAPTLTVGQQLGDRYAVLGLIGIGGMGAVYRAFDRVLDEEVALKVVRADQASLREEVRLAQQVAHRNVCRTYDLELVDGQHYVKMEYIPGETLADQLARSRRLPIDRTIAIARAVADGLAAAHARNIVHRDLKPSNVMLDGDRVVILDFGLAQRVGASDRAGTLGYMAPEQLAGDAVDARADLHALGCLAFEMLVGAPPFGADTSDAVAWRQRELRPDVRHYRPDAPRWLARAIEALLDLDPDARVHGAELLACGHRRAAKLAVPAAVATLLVVASAAWGWSRPSTWEPRITDLAAYDENADKPALAPDGRSFSFSSDRGHRDGWAIYLAIDGTEPRRISPAGETCLGSRWVRDGSAVLMSCYVGGERRIIRVPIDGGVARDLGPGWTVDDCGDALAVVVTRPTGAESYCGKTAAIATSSPCRPSRSPVAIAAASTWSTSKARSAIRCSAAIRSSSIATATRRSSPTRTPSTARRSRPTAARSWSRCSAARESSLYEISLDGGAMHELTPHSNTPRLPTSRATVNPRVRSRSHVQPAVRAGSAGPIQKTFGSSGCRMSWRRPAVGPWWPRSSTINSCGSSRSIWPTSTSAR